MKLFRVALLLTVSVFSGSLYAGVTVGQPFPALTLEDQFGDKHTVGGEDQLVIMAFDMDASGPLGEFLNEQPETFLASKKTRYVADISAMPGIITKLFALPKMRDYSYKMMLNREDDFQAQFDVEEGKLTVYRLDAGVVQAIEFIDGAAAVKLFQ